MQKNKKEDNRGEVENSNTDTNSQPRQYKYWNVTVKYTDKLTAEFLESLLMEFCENWTFQLEKGETTDYKHYQLFFKVKNKKGVRFTAIKKYFPTDHIEQTRNIKAGEEYCMKEDTRLEGPWIYPRPIKLITDLYDWQKDIVKIIDKEPDDRKVIWVYDKEGGKGKTSFCKYLVKKKNAFYCTGKKNDILYGASNYTGNIYCLDYCRSNETYVSYDAIESLKNGIWYNTKYESNMVIRNCSHVICFANFEPDYNALSKDRWIPIEL